MIGKYNYGTGRRKNAVARVFIKPGKGNIVVMMGELSNQAAVQRTKDIHDVMASGNCGVTLNIIDEQTANWSRDEAQDMMTNWLSTGTEFDAVISNNDEMAIGAIQAMKAAGMDMKNVIVGGDFRKLLNALSHVDEGALAEVLPFRRGQKGLHLVEGPALHRRRHQAIEVRVELRAAGQLVRAVVQGECRRRVDEVRGNAELAPALESRDRSKPPTPRSMTELPRKVRSPGAAGGGLPRLQDLRPPLRIDGMRNFVAGNFWLFITFLLVGSRKYERSAPERSSFFGVGH